MTDEALMPPRWSSVAQAATLVVMFWWLATGLLLGLPRTPQGLEAAALVASLIGGSGMALAILLRHDDSPAAAWWGFLAGGTLWGWVQAALYGGWLVGPGAPLKMTLPPSRLAEAFEALRSTAWSDLASLGVVVVTACLAVGAKNRMPFWTVLMFWSAHQVARLNVFFGVANPGANLLPDHLAFLKQFIGPESNSPLLPVSVLAWLGISVLLARWGWRAGTLFHRRAGLVLGVLAALAALEHLLLGLPSSLPLWNSFLSGRAGG
jgi:putative photosynthetic complex assembly protein 2